MTDEQQEFRLVELARRLANVVRPGVVTALDLVNERVRVKYAEEKSALTDWLPWVATRAGGDASWWAPEVGEQVLLLAPSGELSQAIVLGSLYSDAHPAPSSDPDKHLVRYSDGAEIEYDRAAHRLRAVLPAGGAAEITAPDGVTITGDVMVTGDVTIEGGVDASGDIEADGKVKADGDVEAGGKRRRPATQVEDLPGDDGRDTHDLQHAHARRSAGRDVVPPPERKGG